MTKAERELLDGARRRAGSLRHEAKVFRDRLDECEAERDRLRAIASNARWHAVYGAAVARDFGERRALGREVLDRRWQKGVVDDCKTEADEFEEAWAELHQEPKVEA